MRKLLAILLLCLITTSANAQFFAPNQKPCLGLKVNRGHQLSQGLVGCWLFNEGSGNKVFDLSGNGNTGTFVAQTHFVPGKFGHCLKFDGTGDYFTLANAVAFSGTFSIGIWFNTDSDLTNRTILGTYDGDDDYLLLTTSTSIRLRTTATRTYTVPTMSAGVWYFVVFTRDASNNLRCYLNGVESSTGAIVDVNPFNINAIGKGHTGAFDWQGKLDVPIIYNRAFSSSEVALLYREPFCMVQPAWNYMLYGAISVTPSGQVIFIMN